MLKRGVLIGILFVLLLWAILPSAAQQSSKPLPVTDQDLEYLLKSIDTEKRTLQPGKPENEFQSIMTEYIKELTSLESKHKGEIGQLGPIGFSSFEELRQKKQVLTLRHNLTKYWACRKGYYEQGEELMKKYDKRLGKEAKKGRLEGTPAYYMERLEESYARDLKNFYDFILDHHKGMIFTKGNILMQDEKWVSELNQLWDRTVKSATALTTAREKGVEIMFGSMGHLKKQQEKGKNK